MSDILKPEDEAPHYSVIGFDGIPDGACDCSLPVIRVSSTKRCFMGQYDETFSEELGVIDESELREDAEQGRITLLGTPMSASAPGVVVFAQEPLFRELQFEATSIEFTQGCEWSEIDGGVWITFCPYDIARKVMNAWGDIVANRVVLRLRHLFTGPNDKSREYVHEQLDSIQHLINVGLRASTGMEGSLKKLYLLYAVVLRAYTGGYQEGRNKATETLRISGSKDGIQEWNYQLQFYNDVAAAEVEVFLRCRIAASIEVVQREIVGWQHTGIPNMETASNLFHRAISDVRRLGRGDKQGQYCEMLARTSTEVFSFIVQQFGYTEQIKKQVDNMYCVFHWGDEIELLISDNVQLMCILCIPFVYQDDSVKLDPGTMELVLAFEEWTDSQWTIAKDKIYDLKTKLGRIAVMSSPLEMVGV